MTPEQKAVVLEAAQEMQHNDKWWEEFEGKWHGIWTQCMSTMNPLSWSHVPVEFRRRPKTITVTMPEPACCPIPIGIDASLNILFTNVTDRDTALAAIRAEMEKK